MPLPTIPDAAALSEMPAEEILAALRRYGVDPDFGAFEERVLSITKRVARGVSTISPALARALRQQVERAYTLSVQQATKRLVTDMREQAQIDAGAQPDWLWIWIAVGDNRTCDSCDPLHGDERTLDDWGALEPGSAELTCMSNCRCERVPINPD